MESLTASHNKLLADLSALSSINVELNRQLFECSNDPVSEVPFEIALEAVSSRIIREIYDPEVQSRLSAPVTYDMSASMNYTDEEWLLRLPPGSFPDN